MASKRCQYCGRWFHPDPRTSHQKACSREECRRARQRQKLRSWRKLHPDHAERYQQKVQAWAKAYPDYWCQWRTDNAEYRERERRRMRTKRKRARRVAKETAMAQIAVDKLRDIQTARPESVAKETALSRRVDAVVEFLFWKEAVAKRNRMAVGTASAG